MFVCAKAWRYPSQRQAPTARCRHVSSTRTLLIDNYDSYTYNLYQLISLTHKRTSGSRKLRLKNAIGEPVVALNDAVTTEQVQQMIDKGIESIVISPGPGHPDNPKDTGKGISVGICPTDSLQGSVQSCFGNFQMFQSWVYVWGIRFWHLSMEVRQSAPSQCMGGCQGWCTMDIHCLKRFHLLDLSCRSCVIIRWPSTNPHCQNVWNRSLGLQEGVTH